MNALPIEWSLEFSISCYINLEAGPKIHSFIHLDHFYSASSSSLLLRGAPDTARILCINFTPKRQGLAQGPYMAARTGVEPMTLRAKGVDSTNAPHMPHKVYNAVSKYF